MTNLHQLTSQVRHHAVQHGDHIVTTDYCDVTSPYLYFNNYNGDENVGMLPYESDWKAAAGGGRASVGSAQCHDRPTEHCRPSCRHQSTLSAVTVCVPIVYLH